MKIGILGTRGIPNTYGGFEQFADYFSRELVKQGHEVCVYSQSNHSFKKSEYEGVKIIHKFCPEELLGTASQFIYDSLCILDSRYRGFDIILQLGYTSSSIFFGLHPKNSIVITNMDGLEWKRSKYSKKVKQFLKFAEGKAVSKSDYLISDSVGIQTYLKTEYFVESEYIPYGAEVWEKNIHADKILQLYNLKNNEYYALVARLEPENNIEMILDGFVGSKSNKEFIVIGGVTNAFANKMKDKFTGKSIRFVGGIYKQDDLTVIRNSSSLYFHGHTVGGTNPSLLEAMGSGCCIAAHHNEFNKAILGEDALYFENKSEVTDIINQDHTLNKDILIQNNRKKIRENYSIKVITNKYIKMFKKKLGV